MTIDLAELRSAGVEAHAIRHRYDGAVLVDLQRDDDDMVVECSVMLKVVC